MKQCSNETMKKGFTLLEMMVSLFLITVGVMGIFLVINRTLILMTPSSSKVIAAYLTQEGIEIVRNIRDSNWIEQQTNPAVPWNDGLTAGDYQADYNNQPPLDSWKGPTVEASHLKFDNNTHVYSYDSGDYTKFNRRINIESLGPNSLKVTVTVYWGEKGKDYFHTAQEILYNWYTPSTP